MEEEDEGGEAQEMFVSSSSLRISYPTLVQLLTGLELVSVLLPWRMNTITIPTLAGDSAASEGPTSKRRIRSST